MKECKQSGQFYKVKDEDEKERKGGGQFHTGRERRQPREDIPGVLECEGLKVCVIFFTHATEVFFVVEYECCPVLPL